MKSASPQKLPNHSQKGWVPSALWVVSSARPITLEPYDARVTWWWRFVPRGLPDARRVRPTP